MLEYVSKNCRSLESNQKYKCTKRIEIMSSLDLTISHDCIYELVDLILENIKILN